MHMVTEKKSMTKFFVNVYSLPFKNVTSGFCLHLFILMMGGEHFALYAREGGDARLPAFRAARSTIEATRHLASNIYTQ